MKNTAIIKTLLIIFFLNLALTSRDPFSILGIPSLNPSLIFQEDFSNTPKPKQSDPTETFIPNEDLPPFLRNASNLTEKEGLSVLSRFVIVNDISLKKLGAVFDMSGFDGIMSNEAIFPLGTKERLAQRARSAAKIFMKTSLGGDYEAYGAEEYPQLRTDWKMFKVLMIGKMNPSSQIYLRVCIPEDEMMTGIVNQVEVGCMEKIKYIEDFRRKSDVYIRRVQRAKFFQGTGGKGKVQLKGKVVVPFNQQAGMESNVNLIQTAEHLKLGNRGIQDTQMLSNNYLYGKGKLNLRKPETLPSPLQASVNSFEKQIDGINLKVANLEQRVEKDEKKISQNSADLIEIKSSLDQHFNKLDTILEKLVTKIK